MGGNDRLACLWITKAVPYPRNAGDRLWSAGLIEALARSEVAVTVIGLERPADERPPAPFDVEVIEVKDSLRGELMTALTSPYPLDAGRRRTPAMLHAVGEALRRPWDAIVLDGISVGWALELVDRARTAVGDPTVVLYLAHNDEAAVARSMTTNADVSVPRRVGIAQNTMKVMALENRLLRRADLVACITDEDRAKLASRCRPESMFTVSPGFDGVRVPARNITESVPRRAIVLGSFTWAPKAENLRQFLIAADPLFAKAGVELDVVGSLPDGLRETLGPDLRATTLHGFVEDPTPHLANARMAVVPELVGGGFKLKFLDYIFSRVPVASISHAMSGLPPEIAQNLIGATDLVDLAEQILTGIGRIDDLNRMQNGAFAAAESLYDWSERGELLHRRLTEAVRIVAA